MKTPLLMTLAGAACSLLMSCQSTDVCAPGGRYADVYVTTRSGAPISGAQIEPATVSFGCTQPLYTDTCGAAALPRQTSGGAVYNVRKEGYRTVHGVMKDAGRPTHIVMDVGWPK